VLGKGWRGRAPSKCSRSLHKRGVAGVEREESGHVNACCVGFSGM
jgi:hypothetical protein